MVSLRSIFLFKNDRSTQSFDPEALDGVVKVVVKSNE